MRLLEDGVKVLCGTDSYAAGIMQPRCAEIIHTLQVYIHEIERFNTAYGLVSYKNIDELIIKHILNSISGCGILARNIPYNGGAADGLHEPAGGMHGAEIADIGSGAGLPGIPLAILFPHCRFTLIERSERRSGFLCHVTAVLGLHNVSVLNTDISAIKPLPCTAGQGGGGFNGITFRAFHPMDKKVYTSIARLLAAGGVIIAYKGRRERVHEELAALAGCPLDWQVIPCPTPFLDEERCLVIIRPKQAA